MGNTLGLDAIRQKVANEGTIALARIQAAAAEKRAAEEAKTAQLQAKYNYKGGKVSSLLSYMSAQDRNKASLMLAKANTTRLMNMQKLENYYNLKQQTNQLGFASAEMKNRYNLEYALAGKEENMARNRFNLEYALTNEREKTHRQANFLSNNALKYATSADTLLSSRRIDTKNQALRFLETGRETGFTSKETEALRQQMGQMAAANWQPVNELQRVKNEKALNHAQRVASTVDLLKINPSWTSKVGGKPSKITKELENQPLANQTRVTSGPPILIPKPTEEDKPLDQVTYTPPTVEKPTLDKDTTTYTSRTEDDVINMMNKAAAKDKPTKHGKPYNPVTNHFVTG